MKRSAAIPCSRAISLFRGLYARVARELGFDVSYVSRIARGERRSEIIEEAICREFNIILASINGSSHPSAKRQSKKKTLPRS
jgi:transcriptional regulator with XRE-family HTH domain